MIPIWWDTQETHTRYYGGYSHCPHCGGYCSSTITGYRCTARLWFLPVLALKTNWRRACSACGKSDPITKKEAKIAAVENDEWPAYTKAVKIPTFLVLGLILVVIGAFMLYVVLEPELKPVYRAEDTTLSTLDSGDYVAFDTLYLLDSYGYETDENDAVVSYSFLAYYYEGDDPAPCFLSLRIADSDDLFDTVLNALDADGVYVGDLYGPAYGAISDSDDVMQSYYKEAITEISRSIKLINTGKNMEYYSEKKGELDKIELIVSLVPLLLGLALIVGYLCKNNPKHPPKLRSY